MGMSGFLWDGYLVSSMETWKVPLLGLLLAASRSEFQGDEVLAWLMAFVLEIHLDWYLGSGMEFRKAALLDSSRGRRMAQAY